jgi:hypothetical protein
MNKNEIFRKFLDNPLLKEKTNLTEKQLNSIDLHTCSPNRLIDVIKTTIIHFESDQSTDLVARKILQSFKRDTI